MTEQQSPEFRAQDIKTRRLEIAAILAERKRAFIVDGIAHPFTERVTLEAEDAQLALEARVIGASVVAAKVERRKQENDGLITQLQAANAGLLFACRETRIRLLGLAGMERWVDMLSDAIEQATGSRA